MKIISKAFSLVNDFTGIVCLRCSVIEGYAHKLLLCVVNMPKYVNILKAKGSSTNDFHF